MSNNNNFLFSKGMWKLENNGIGSTLVLDASGYGKWSDKLHNFRNDFLSHFHNYAVSSMYRSKHSDLKDPWGFNTLWRKGIVKSSLNKDGLEELSFVMYSHFVSKDDGSSFNPFTNPSDVEQEYYSFSSYKAVLFKLKKYVEGEFPQDIITTVILWYSETDYEYFGVPEFYRPSLPKFLEGANSLSSTSGLTKLPLRFYTDYLFSNTYSETVNRGRVLKNSNDIMYIRSYEFEGHKTLFNSILNKERSNVDGVEVRTILEVVDSDTYDYLISKKVKSTEVSVSVSDYGRAVCLLKLLRDVKSEKSLANLNLSKYSFIVVDKLPEDKKTYKNGVFPYNPFNKVFLDEEKINLLQEIIETLKGEKESLEKELEIANKRIELLEGDNDRLVQEVGILKTSIIDELLQSDANRKGV